MALVAQLFGLSMYDAAIKIDSDFRVGAASAAEVPNTGPSKAETRKQIQAWANARFDTACKVERQAKSRLASGNWPPNDASWDNPAFKTALHALALAQDELEVLQIATAEDLRDAWEGAQMRGIA